MAEVVVVYWREIPAQVLARAGRKTARRHLGETYEQAIDRAAMKAGLRDSDAYLAEWRKSDPRPAEGEDLEAVAEAEALRLRADYGADRLKRLIDGGGFEPS